MIVFKLLNKLWYAYIEVKVLADSVTGSLEESVGRKCGGMFGRRVLVEGLMGC